jgi:hypothetical protein
MEPGAGGEQWVRQDGWMRGNTGALDDHDFNGSWERDQTTGVLHENGHQAGGCGDDMRSRKRCMRPTDSTAGPSIRMLAREGVVESKASEKQLEIKSNDSTALGGQAAVVPGHGPFAGKLYLLNIRRHSQAAEIRNHVPLTRNVLSGDGSLINQPSRCMRC